METFLYIFFFALSHNLPDVTRKSLIIKQYFIFKTHRTLVHNTLNL